MFRNKTAYPVYLTIGNLPKEIRRKPSHGGYILLGYLPTSSLKHITNKSARRRTLANLFHACMSRIVEPLEKAGMDGMTVVSGDGVVRRGHPILAIYVGDYPEQVLVTCVKTGTCPSCPVAHEVMGTVEEIPGLEDMEEDCDDDDEGDGGGGKDIDAGFRDLAAILEALDALDEGPTIFKRACEDVGIKPIQGPFWQNLPYTNIYRSMTPDILHQLYQGVLKHLIAWLRTICGDAEIDARCRRLPPNHNIHLFMNGISGLSRVSGAEHDQICRFLLGLIIDIRLPNNLHNGRLLSAVSGMLDFLFLSQYPVHTSQSLDLQDDAFDLFHANKSIFIDLGVRAHFQIPKLHNCRHYRPHIELYGTTDNCNTQYTERLHIDFTKNAYRSTNFKDPFTQMTTWIVRREKIQIHERYIQWRISGESKPVRAIPVIVPEFELKMTKHPSVKAVSLADIMDKYGATYFCDALARYITDLRFPGLTRRELERKAAVVSMPFRSVPVFHTIKYRSTDYYTSNGPSQSVVDAIHIKPKRKDGRGREVPARFDTVLVNDGNGMDVGLKGTHLLIPSST